jgi:hypothetical protein
LIGRLHEFLLMAFETVQQRTANGPITVSISRRARARCRGDVGAFGDDASR